MPSLEERRTRDMGPRGAKPGITSRTDRERRLAPGGFLARAHAAKHEHHSLTVQESESEALRNRPEERHLFTAQVSTGPCVTGACARSARAKQPRGTSRASDVCSRCSRARS